MSLKLNVDENKFWWIWIFTKLNVDELKLMKLNVVEFWIRKKLNFDELENGWKIGWNFNNEIKCYWNCWWI